jgi:hypothetical protein
MQQDQHRGQRSSPPDLAHRVEPTRVRVSPQVFLGDLVCSEDGGMHRYQATLLDVTDGLEEAFQLPSSAVVSCKQDVEFEYVKAGRRYIAQVSGFDRSDISAQNPGSPIIVDESGAKTSPRWTTTCWGYDGLEPAGLGGASGELTGEGGSGGDGPTLGVESFSKTIVTVRGCESLTGSSEQGPTAVSFNIQTALLGLDCGSEAGQIGTFTVALKGDVVPEPPIEGGAGGAGGAPGLSIPTSTCGETLVLSDVPPATYLTFIAQGLDAVTEEVLWTTECNALSVAGITVQATCDPAEAL